MLDNYYMHPENQAPVFNELSAPVLVDIIRNDGVGILLTDTVYGIVGRAASTTAATRIMEVKGRENKPGTLIAANVQQLIGLGLPPDYLKLCQAFWPGPVSIVIPAGPELEYIHLGKDSIVTRITDKPEFVGLLEAVGPLLTTSANLPGEPVVTTIAEAQTLFGAGVDFYVDGGHVADPVASTIIKIDITVLRQGAATINPGQKSAET